MVEMEHIASSEIAANTYTSKYTRILVVDDNPILLRTVKEMLSEYYSIGIAVSASQAFSSISKWRPDIILLDYEMPVTDGREVLLKLRSSANTRNIPVIFFTATADRDTVVKIVELIPDGYILKPPNKQKMISVIESVWRKSMKYNLQTKGEAKN